MWSLSTWGKMHPLFIWFNWLIILTTYARIAPMPTQFNLHPRLATDTLPVAELPLCRALLMNDSRWPWLILVPRVAELREVHHLETSQRATLMEEMALAAKALDAVCQPQKINLGALGNLVPQLHVHVIGRHGADPAWPGPVWGFGEAEPYADGQGEDLVLKLAPHLAGLG